MMKTKTTMVLAMMAVMAIALLCCFPESALARAGGGGGRSGGGWLSIVVWPILLIYSAILTHMVRKKRKESRALMAQLEAVDASWHSDKIKARIEEAFFKIQHAWMERNQDLAKEYMSERLYQKHKTQTDQMIRDNRKNILEAINLKTAHIVEVADFKDDSKDRIWVYLEGTMIDYTVNAQTNEHISGDNVRDERFKELWKFIKDDHNSWVLDEIDQDAEIADLAGMRSFSEEL